MNIDDQVIIGIKLMCDNALRSHWDSDVMQTTLKNIRDLTASYIIVKEPEGGGDEMISPKGIVTSKKAYDSFHAEGGGEDCQYCHGAGTKDRTITEE